MSKVVEEKKRLRKQLSRERARLDIGYKQKYDQWICDKLWDLCLEKKVKVVHCYLPMGTEINIRHLIERLLKNEIVVVAPKTLPNRKLQNLILSSLNEVEKGVFGTTHPSNSMEYNGEYDIIVVPGLAFDASNYRLGYGGGYYDTFLNQNSMAHKLGIFYPFQEINQVPIEKHDVRLDTILVNKLK